MSKQEKAVQKEQAARKKKEQKQRLRGLQQKLAALQQPLREAGIPVIVLAEGPVAAGKGALVSRLISRMDPRGYQVWPYDAPSDAVRQHPFLWPFWQALPPKGGLAVFQQGWYCRAEQLGKKADGNELLLEINEFERQLCDDGYLVIKLFLSIGQEEQKRRLRRRARRKETAWQVTDRDWQQNKAYPERMAWLAHVLKETQTPHAPWHMISGEEPLQAACDALQIVADDMEKAIQNGVPRPAPLAPRSWPLLTMKQLGEVDLSPALSKEAYQAGLKQAQKRLCRLHHLFQREKIPVVLVFEGWDAAGKGGAIRRLSQALDPRAFDVIPISAPTPEELSRHYLWRFWNALPPAGSVGVFDRSWYGRVLVERVEQLTPEARWRMAYEEINQWEWMLHQWGALVLKFWIHIDKDTQKHRFDVRQSTPEKRYKITEEDWRNREKWDQYEQAANEMLEKTSTEFAPWVVVPGNDKRYARLGVLQALSQEMERHLKKVQEGR
jgi:polyphosphate:AMP phosphotransferase